MKQKIFKAELPLSDSTSGTAVNLRYGDDGLQPVGQPQIYTGLAGARPLTMLRHGDKGVMLSAAGTKLFYSDSDNPSATQNEVVHKLPGSPLCVLRTAANQALMMTSQGCVQVECDGAGVSVKSMDVRYPAISLLPCEDAAELMATVSERKLSKSYSTGGRLVRNDAEAVSGDLVQAYLELCSSAAATGRMIQPVIARYKLFDFSGNLLFTSSPVLLGAPNGSSANGVYSLYSDDYQTLKSYNVTARTWQLKAELPAATSDSANVARAEIFFTPMFHPFHPDEPAYISMGRGSGTMPFAHVALPGYRNGLNSGYRGNAARLVMQAIAHIDDIEERVAVITCPFTDSHRTMSVAVAPQADAAAASRSLYSAMRKAVKPVSHLQSLLSAPHGFSATSCSRDGDSVAWGNITARRFEGFSIAGFAVDTTSQPWTESVIVRFADGTAVSHSYSHSSGFPAKLSPVFTYPSGDAVSMTIELKCNNIIYGDTFELTPDRSGRFSVFAHEDAMPIALPPAIESFEKVEASDVELPSVVAIAPASRPQVIENFIDLKGGAVKAIVPKSGNEQSWEFGRSRFIIGTEGGIFSLGVSQGHKSLAARRLYSKGIWRSDALCSGPNGESFAVIESTSASGGILLHFSASGRFSRIDHSDSYIAVGYNENYDELWAAKTDGSADIFTTSGERLFYPRPTTGRYYFFRRDDIKIDSFATLNNELWVLTPTAPARTAAEQPSPWTPIAYSAILPVSGFTPRHITFDMGCRLIEGTIAIGRLTHQLWPIKECVLAGSLRSPLRLPLIARHAPRLQITITAITSPDFRLRTIEAESGGALFLTNHEPY